MFWHNVCQIAPVVFGGVVIVGGICCFATAVCPFDDHPKWRRYALALVAFPGLLTLGAAIIKTAVG